MKFWALSYSLPANPSRHRVAVWKALRELGAVYLQPAVAIVPQREGMREALIALRDRVISCAGTAALLTMEYDEQADEQAMVASMRNLREEEYAGIGDDARRLAAKLAWDEGQAGSKPADYAAAYRLECRRLFKRLEVAQAHDFFSAPGAEDARTAIPGGGRPTARRGKAGAQAARRPAVLPCPPAEAQSGETGAGHSTGRTYGSPGTRPGRKRPGAGNAGVFVLSRAVLPSGIARFGAECKKPIPLSKKELAFYSMNCANIHTRPNRFSLKLLRPGVFSSLAPCKGRPPFPQR